MTSWRFDILQFVDANGAPLESGYINTYQAGSAGATPKAAYQNKGLTTAHALPAAGGIVLDAKGMPDTDTPIYLDCSSNFYQIKVYDSDDVLQWEYDHIEGIKLDWDSPDYSLVANYAALGTGDHDGQTKLTIDTQAIYSWDLGTTSWEFIATLPAVANAAALPASGVHDGQIITCQDNGNKYTWDDGNNKWRVMPGNIYATDPAAATYSIEEGTEIFQTTVNKGRWYNAVPFWENMRDDAPRGYKAGLILARDNITTLGISRGIARDNTDTVTMRLSTNTFQKDIAGNWVFGDTNGAIMNDGSAYAASNWYHVWIVWRDADGFADIAVSQATVNHLSPTLTGCTYMRWIGAYYLDINSHIDNFVQWHNHFLWDTLIYDYNGSASVVAGGTLQAVKVPPDLKSLALIRFTTSAVGNYFLLSSPDWTQIAPAAHDTLPNHQLSLHNKAQDLMIRTNTSKQINQYGSAANDINIITLGWITDFNCDLDF